MQLESNSDSNKNGESKIPPMTHTDLREYAWQYFLVHAQARLTTFSFYVGFCTIVVAGLYAVLSQGIRPQLGAPIAFLLTFLSFVYWKVDIRHKELIKHAEAALKWLEQTSGLPDIDGVPHPSKLFCREEHITNRLPRFPSTISLQAFWSYSTCVKTVFSVLGAAGFITGIVLLALWK